MKRQHLTLALVAGTVGAFIALLIASPLDELLILRYFTKYFSRSDSK